MAIWDAEVADLKREVRELHLMTGLLIEAVGGSIVVTDEARANAPREYMVSQFRDEEHMSTVFRAQRRDS